MAGLLHVATSAEEGARLPELARLFVERRAAGFGQVGDVSEITGDEARARFPALGPAILGAVATTGAARVDGRLLRDALRRAAERRGARIVSGDAALAVAATGGRVDAVLVGGERLAAGTVIVAGGAWSAALGERLGVALPVFPAARADCTSGAAGERDGRLADCGGLPCALPADVRAGALVAGATRESESGFDARMTAGGVHEALVEALRVAPGLGGATLVEVRIGLRPASPDGLPLLGWLPGYDNVLVATGHGPSGLQLGPYSGAVVAGLALGEPAPLALEPFAVERFARA